MCTYGLVCGCVCVRGGGGGGGASLSSYSYSPCISEHGASADLGCLGTWVLITGVLMVVINGAVS